MTVKTSVKKGTSQNLQFIEEGAFSAGKKPQAQLMPAIFALEREELAFKKEKRLLCSNVKVLQEQ